MRMLRVSVMLCAFVAAGAHAADPAAMMRDRIKDGMYEVKMYMDALEDTRRTPGGKPGTPMTMRNCITREDLDVNKLAGMKEMAEKECKVSNMRTTANSVSYTSECRGTMNMKVDSTTTFTNTGYVMQMKGVVEGQPWNQRMEARYLGPCSAFKEQTLEEQMKGILGTDQLPLSPEVLKMMRDMEAQEQAKGRPPRGK